SEYISMDHISTSDSIESSKKTLGRYTFDPNDCYLYYQNTNYLSLSHLRIERKVFGLCFDNVGLSTVQRSTFSMNDVGFYDYDGDSNWVSSNTFSRNDYGMIVEDSHDYVIYDNEFNSNIDMAIYVDNTYGGLIRLNDIFQVSQGSGITIEDCWGTEQTPIEIADNEITSVFHYGIRILHTEHVWMEDNYVMFSYDGIGIEYSSDIGISKV
ncbi:unnamed protein product, partial [marine sediment metagenome]